VRPGERHPEHDEMNHHRFAQPHLL
jgi:hypothetical protein